VSGRKIEELQDFVNKLLERMIKIERRVTALEKGEKK